MDLKQHLEAVWVFGKCRTQCQDGIQLLLAVIVPPGSPSSVPGSCMTRTLPVEVAQPWWHTVALCHPSLLHEPGLNSRVEIGSGTFQRPCLASMGASMAAPKAPRLVQLWVFQFGVKMCWQRCGVKIPQ